MQVRIWVDVDGWIWMDLDGLCMIFTMSHQTTEAVADSPVTPNLNDETWQQVRSIEFWRSAW